jgi:methanogenic corrinoid protein MtbC1
MQQHLADGLAAAEAAALASSSTEVEVEARPFEPGRVREELADALGSFDEPRAQAALDRLLSSATVEAALSQAILPFLRELGERWERGEVSVAQEHFASSTVRGRLLGLARGWGRGIGPVALLACLPGELHELGLLAFGLALRSQGWRIAYLGSDTPLETVEKAAGDLQPSLVVLSAVTATRVREAMPQLEGLASRHRVALGGEGAADLDPSVDVLVLAGDPVLEAERVSGLVHAAG